MGFSSGMALLKQPRNFILILKALITTAANVILICFLCSRLPKAGVGHTVFRHDVSPYVRTCLCHISLGGHNLGTFYARKLQFGMLLTQF